MPPLELIIEVRNPVTGEWTAERRDVWPSDGALWDIAAEMWARR